MPVYQNNCQIIPAPFFTYKKEILLAGDQRRIGNTYIITITGKLVAYMGSPQTGTLVGAGWGGYKNLFWQNSGYPLNESITVNNRIHALEVKEEALRNLFAVDGQWLQFESIDGSISFRCQSKNAQIEFGLDDIYFNTRPYTITCEADIVYVNGSADDSNPSITDYIQNCSETWDIQEGDIVKTFKLTHNVSAVGKRMFDNLGNQTGDPWLHAQNFVNGQLVLGYNGWNNFSYNPGSFIVPTSALASGVINFSNLSPYNYAQSQNIDEQGGSFSVQETWTLASSSGAENYVINLRKITDQSYTTVTASIQGSIKGFYINLFDYDTRLQAAQWQWSQVVGTPLYNRVSSYASGIPLNLQPIQAAIDEDYNTGTLSYNYEFSNTLFEGDAFESYTVNRKTSVDTYKSTFGIAGSIRGRRYDGDTDSTLYLQRAQAWWNQVSVPPTLYNRVISSKYFPVASSIGLQPSPISFSVDVNEADGVISYNYEFDNRKNDANINDNSVIDEYQISKHFDRNDGISSYSINGTVKGLNIADSPDPRGAAFAAASGFYVYTVQPALYSRITNFFNISLPDTQPYLQEVVYNGPAATVEYQSTFYNYPLPLISGVLSEMISVSQENWEQNVQVIANVPVPGRTLGPVLQNVNTTNAKMRRLSIETIVGPTGSTNLLTSFNLKPNYDQYVLQLVPVGGYTENDVEEWSWKLGRYTRNTSWIFE